MPWKIIGNKYDVNKYITPKSARDENGGNFEFAEDVKYGKFEIM